MSGRRSTPRGQMTRGANSGPAIMMMPPHIRMTFVPNPPLKHIPPIKPKRKKAWTGVSDYLVEFERAPPAKKSQERNPKKLKEEARKRNEEKHKQELEPVVGEYRKEQRECNGEFEGMNCYNTLFVGRLAYEVTERKLLRELEVFGPIKDLKLVHDRDGKSRGYAFVEYEHDEDMKRAYRAADGMKMEGRHVVVDVERGHTVPNWLPRRLGGGLGGTRLGGKDQNVSFHGRYDPARPEASRPARSSPAAPQRPPAFSGGRGRGGERYGPPRGREWERRGDWGRKRNRSRSPDRRHGNSRRRH